MKCFLIILSCFLLSCSHVSLTGGHVLVQSKSKQFSCYSGAINGGTNCCWPYKEKLMICAYSSVTFVGNETESIVIRFVPEN